MISINYQTPWPMERRSLTNTWAKRLTFVQCTACRHCFGQFPYTSTGVMCPLFAPIQRMLCVFLFLAPPPAKRCIMDHDQRGSSTTRPYNLASPIYIYQMQGREMEETCSNSISLTTRYTMILLFKVQSYIFSNQNKILNVHIMLTTIPRICK